MLGADLFLQVVLSVFSDGLFDAAYMKRSPHSTIIEFFPSQSFVPDREILAQAIGVNYVVSWPDQ